MNRLCADDLCGVGLFFVSNGAQLIDGHIGGRRVVETLVAASQKKVRDLVSGACPACKRRTTKKFRIIRMSEDDQNVLGSFPMVRLFGHICSRLYFSLALACWIFHMCTRRHRDDHTVLRICGAKPRVHPMAGFHPYQK